MQSDADLIAGIREQALNRYLEKHHSLHAASYSGDGESSALGFRYSYSAPKPPVCHFTVPADFTAEYRKAVLSDPLFADVRGKKEIIDTIDAPGILIDLEKMRASLHAPDGAELANARFSLQIMAGVTMEAIPPGRYRFSVAAVRVRKDDLQITPSGPATDAIADVTKMLQHVLQATIAGHVRRFFEEVPLPQPHLAIDHFSTHLQSLAIENDTLLLALGMAGIPPGAPALHDVTESIGQFGPAQETLLCGAELPLTRQKDTKPGTVSVKKSYAQQLKGGPRDFSERRLGASSTASLPDGELFVAISQQVFQKLAERTLTLANTEKHERDQGWSRYWFKDWIGISEPRAQLEDAGISVKASLTGGAAGGASLRGPLSCAGSTLTASVSADPGVVIDAGLYADPRERELWLWPRDIPCALAVDATMQPSFAKLDHVADTAMASIGKLFSALLLPAISMFFRFRIVRLTDTVPGTPVPMQPELGAVANWNHRLLVSFDMTLE
jgi:hypothetical protein